MRITVRSGARGRCRTPLVTTKPCPGQLDGAVFEVDDESTLDHVEELVEVIVLVPVIFALDDAEPDDRVVHLAERLVVPGMGDLRH